MGPGAHLQQLKAEYVLQGQPRQRRFLAQTRPPKGPSNHSPAALSRIECNRDSLKILAKLECYRLNTPQKC